MAGFFVFLVGCNGSRKIFFLKFKKKTVPHRGTQHAWAHGDPDRRLASPGVRNLSAKLSPARRAPICLLRSAAAPGNLSSRQRTNGVADTETPHAQLTTTSSPPFLLFLPRTDGCAPPHTGPERAPAAASPAAFHYSLSSFP